MRFKIIDITTGKEPTSEVIAEIAYNNGLMVHDIDGFGINEDGQIILMDDCGNYAFADNTRFEAKLVEEKREQESCEDCISRNAIIKTLNKMDRYVADELTLCDTERKFPQNEVFIVDDVYEEIAEQLPSVQPKTGHWIATEDGFECSECGCISRSRADFCQYCGAKME